MAYGRMVGNRYVYVDCMSDPGTNFARHHSDIEKQIIADGYVPQTSMDNLVSMVILSFDCDDNYGEYDPETGMGGYGDEFTLDQCFAYVEASGGWELFDWET